MIFKITPYIFAKAKAIKASSNGNKENGFLYHKNDCSGQVNIRVQLFTAGSADPYMGKLAW